MASGERRHGLALAKDVHLRRRRVWRGNGEIRLVVEGGTGRDQADDDRRRIGGERCQARRPADEPIEIVAADSGVDGCHLLALLRVEHDSKTRTLPRVRRERTRWDEDNVAPLNPWAFIVVGGFVLGVAGLVLWFSLT